MANGWAKLGAALAGTSDADRAEIERKTMVGLAARDRALAGARMDIEKAKALDSLGQHFATLGIENADAAAGVSRAGVNLNTLTSGMGNIQEQGFRQAAADAARSGNYAGANAELFGVAGSPVTIPQVSGGMLLSNRLVPGGGTVTPTDVGASQIRANDARGQASLITANRPRASGGGSKATGGSGKLSQVQTARMNAELGSLKPQIESALDEIAKNQGAKSGPGARALADAQARLADLQKQQNAIFDKYEGGAATPAVDFVIDDPESIPPAVRAALPSLAQHLTPAESQQLSPAAPPPATRPQPAEAPANVTRAGDAPLPGEINPKLFDMFQGSITGQVPPARPTSKAEYDALPKGTRFISPDGKLRTKP